MSGRRHHYLPRFLLKGFASRLERDEAYTWVFRRDRKPFEPNIDKIAVQRDFYGQPGQAIADQLITSDENKLFSPLLDDLRSTTLVSPEDYPLVTDLVLNLANRTNHLRESLQGMTDSLMQSVSTQYQDAEILKNFVYKEAPKNIQEIMKYLNVGHINDQTKRKIYNLLMEKLLIQFESQVSQIQDTMNQFYHYMHNRLPSIIQDGHNRGLAKLASPYERSEKLADLKWYVHTADDNSYILGDIGPIAYNEDKNVCRTLIQEMNPKIIYLPISDNQILIGSVKENPEYPSPDALNVHIAEISREFFISSQKTQRELRYVNYLGNNAEMLTEEELSNLIERKRKNSRNE
jgi:hypothetical protein